MTFTFSLLVNISNSLKATSNPVAGPVDVIMFLSITILWSLTFAPYSASCFLLNPSIKSYVVAFLFFKTPDLPIDKAATQTEAIIFCSLSNSRISSINFSAYASS